MNIIKLGREVLTSKERCIEWCQNMNLVPRQKSCPICEQPMSFDANRGVSGRWRCKKRSLHRQINRRGQEEVEIAVADGTWFSKTKLSIQKSLLLTYCWSQKLTFEQTIQECCFDEQCLSRETVADWHSYCREVTDCS